MIELRWYLTMRPHHDPCDVPYQASKRVLQFRITGPELYTEWQDVPEVIDGSLFAAKE